MNSDHSVMIRMLRPLRAPLSLLSLLVLAACGGGGGGGDDNSDDGGNTPSVTISGKITFDRVSFKASGRGLNLSAPVEVPARLVVVEALDSSSGVVATTNTDAAGDYSVIVPANTQIRIRAKAQMLKTGAAPTWNFRVLNNTNSDALYAVDGSTFSSGATSSVRNLRATSGWDGTSYDDAARAAAPFAILDTAYQARGMIVGAAADITFPALDLFWSPDNKSSDEFCPDDGDILISSYVTFEPDLQSQDGCGNTIVEGIYLLGDFAEGNGDTDEFDQHVIAHEFGHYAEDQFSRSDSIGGEHSPGNTLDLRTAFGEGWGNAFGAMVLNDPVYRDSVSGQANEIGFDMEADGSDSNEGWYSELSVSQILWDLFDSGTESGDSVALGFPALYDVFAGAQKTTDALTSIYSFTAALKSANSAAAAGINALLSREEISGDTAFGTGETNFAGQQALLSPTYTPITLNGGPVQVCGTRVFGIYNRLGNRRFLYFDLAQSRAVQITAQGLVGSTPTPAPDPDIGLWRRGLIGTSQQPGVTEFYNTPVLPVGTYIIEVADYTHTTTIDLSSRRGDSCMTVSVSGS